jgi:multiple sugar transport system substrate-binding protein
MAFKGEPMKKALLPALATACVVAMLAGCSSSGSGGANRASGETVHLVFRQFDPANQIDGLVTAVDGWNKDHPKIQVKLETLSPDNPQQFAREANSGSGPDIQQIGYANVSLLANPKILLPLDDLMKKDPLKPGIDQYLATDMTKLNGKNWAVPWTADTMAMVYNPAVLEASGISTPPTTWEQLASDARTVAKTSNGKTQGFCFAASSAPTSAQWFPINYYLWNHGWNLIEKKGDAWQTGVTQKQLASTIDYFNSMFTSGATSASNISLSDYADPQIAGALSDGSCAMTYEPPQSFRAIEKQSKADLATAPIAGGLKDGSTHLGGRALGINRNTANPEAAWEFVKYLTSATTFKTYQQYPASKSTLTTLSVPKSEGGYTKQLPHSVSLAKYIGSGMPLATVQQLVVQQFTAVYSGQSSSDDAAKAILNGLESGIGG